MQISTADYIAEKAAAVQDALHQALPQEWDVPERLREAMMYSLNAGGKRLRPVLVFAAAEAVHGEAEAADAAMPIACAIEMVHTYSLIHDDLPAMDDDDFRRGKPTNHKVFGEAVAILAGDALLTHAFYCVAQAAKTGRVSAEATLAIVEELARLAGAPGMVGGQTADLLGEQGITTIEELNYIHLHKTSDLIAFSVQAGGRAAGASPRQLEALGVFGRKLGLAFQIQDDILDLVGDEVKLGKKTNSDVEQSKVTYPYLLGMDKSRAEVERLTAEAKQAVEEAGFAITDRLLGIADYLMKRDH
ncbi:polyprenyl synthetase family protein [Paenibacillus tarimensis]|uniref:polyprenyl synthetase family protein n=1 Tax=Paenibacillus tarimensis TaxID=416012 RepID=UPI001F379286|nr:farnesyl diphosphate synthase [Paenibacillus tarimensis]MCF2942444.1 polyprenyl synthetase family protein [Paenibacillus tarimensis]